jgi:hypothetical protein
VCVTLDLTPAIELKKRLTSGAFCSGLMIYLEGIAAFVLLTERALHPPFLVPIAAVLGAHVLLIRKPARLLVRGRLPQSYAASLLLALLFITIVAAGSRAGEQRQSGALLASVVVVGTAWPVVSAIRSARAVGAQLHSADPSVLTACLSFDVRTAIATRVRSFGGGRTRWAAPFFAAFAASVGTLIALGLLQQALGLRLGALIGQAAGLAGLWTFYRAMRHAKLRASELRARDARKPVLILREFADDALGAARFDQGRSFEHFFTAELDRIGPTISVGRPGERLAPLGASRDYLDGADWKHAVGTMIEQSALAVFVLGASENLLWEFRQTIAAGGRQRTLVIVPPLPDRDELQRRWRRFVEATGDIIGSALPSELPGVRVLAFFFAGDDVVMFVARNKGRSQPWFAKAPGDYRLALRLFEWLRRQRAASGREVDRLVPAVLKARPTYEARPA